MAEYFTDYQEVKKVGNITSVEQEVIDPHLPSAKLDVIEIIGKTKYGLIKEAEEVSPGDETDDNPYNSDDFANVKLAESYFALPYVIIAVNNVATPDGMTKATGFDASRKENLSEFDLQSIEDRYKRLAKNLLKQYTETYDPDEDDSSDLFVSNDITGISI